MAVYREGGTGTYDNSYELILPWQYFPSMDVYGEEAVHKVCSMRSLVGLDLGVACYSLLGISSENGNAIPA